MRVVDRRLAEVLGSGLRLDRSMADDLRLAYRQSVRVCRWINCRAWQLVDEFERDVGDTKAERRVEARRAAAEIDWLAELLGRLETNLCEA